MALSLASKSKGSERLTINQVSEMRSSGLLMSRSIKASLPRGQKVAAAARDPQTNESLLNI